MALLCFSLLVLIIALIVLGSQGYFDGEPKE